MKCDRCCRSAPNLGQNPGFAVYIRLRVPVTSIKFHLLLKPGEIIGGTANTSRNFAVAIFLAARRETDTVMQIGRLTKLQVQTSTLACGCPRIAYSAAKLNRRNILTPRNTKRLNCRFLKGIKIHGCDSRSRSSRDLFAKFKAANARSQQSEFSTSNLRDRLKFITP